MKIENYCFADRESADNAVAALDTVMNRKRGAYLVTGAVMSGKTTLIRALLETRAPSPQCCFPPVSVKHMNAVLACAVKAGYLWLTYPARRKWQRRHPLMVENQGGTELLAFTSSPKWTWRVFRTTRTETRDNRTAIFVESVDMDITPDMERRFRVIRMARDEQYHLRPARFGSRQCDYTGTPPFADAAWANEPDAMCFWCAGTGHPYGNPAYGICECPARRVA